jgi:hypothetical protein
MTRDILSACPAVVHLVTKYFGRGKEMGCPGACETKTEVRKVVGIKGARGRAFAWNYRQ